MDARMDRRRFMRVGAASAAGVVALGGSLHGAAASGADTLAMLGGTPVRTEPFSQVWPIFDETEEQALLGALRSRDWCCLRGHEVYDYQTAFAQAMGAGQCVLSNGGTTALSACLHVLGVGPGDEVITTPRTFIATINVITNAHALPVFVDIDPETGSLDADLIEAAITEHTKVILPVHLAGYPVDIEKIMAIGKKHGIPVVEDACQSVFAEVNGKKVGTFGTGGCISFQEWKSLVCGEGGAILGDDPEFMRRCAAFVNNGRDPAGTLGGYPFPGSNHRMTEFQAAVLGQQFKRFITQDRTRQANGRYLEQRLTKIPGLSPRKRYTPNTRITYVEFDLDYDPEHFEGVPASLFARALRAEGISFVSGGPRRWGRGCHREGMLEEHLKSEAFRRSYSPARLEAYRRSLENLPVMDGRIPSTIERLSFDGKIPFLGPRREMDQIFDAIAKVARNCGTLARMQDKGT
ncbi:MAG TPA: DegT/DnrJ/EryC1/StrS family aminotransferase [Phycisphaerales bacterium]|nr:DegT/DnrJ/EryC1/StrS family aminotransferase [Phycisphaerales bacterium]